TSFTISPASAASSAGLGTSYSSQSISMSSIDTAVGVSRPVAAAADCAYVPAPASTGASPKPTTTVAPAAADRSALIRAWTSSRSAKRVELNELRESLSDFDSISRGESAGTGKVAVAAAGVPRGPSQESAQAGQGPWAAEARAPAA